MVTGYPQVLVGPQSATSARAERTSTRSLFTRMFRRMGQMICGLSGHDLVRHYEQNRYALSCASCGHVSPGWELTAPLPQRRYAGDPERHQLRSHARTAPVAVKTAPVSTPIVATPLKTMVAGRRRVA
jgi:hypothetical protein